MRVVGGGYRVWCEVRVVGREAVMGGMPDPSRPIPTRPTRAAKCISSHPIPSHPTSPQLTPTPFRAPGLVVLDDGREIQYVCIVDILTPYGCRKRLETLWKRCVGISQQPAASSQQPAASSM